MAGELRQAWHSDLRPGLPIPSWLAPMCRPQVPNSPPSPASRAPPPSSSERPWPPHAALRWEEEGESEELPPVTGGGCWGILFSFIFLCAELGRTFMWQENIFFGVFCKMKQRLEFHLPHGPDRWARFVKNSIRLLNTDNQCSASRPCLKSGSYVSLCPKMVVSRHDRL
jgi:hypothetical protein